METNHPRTGTFLQDKRQVLETRGSKVLDCRNSKARPKPRSYSTVADESEHALETGTVPLLKQGCGGSGCDRDLERDWQKPTRNFLRQSRCSRTVWRRDRCFDPCCGWLRPSRYIHSGP